MESKYHISEKTGKKVGGTAHLLHKVGKSGCIDNFEEILREEGRQEMMDRLRPYYSQIERVEQKLDWMMEKQGINFSPNIRVVE
ncbi:hypothetical protein HMPREF3291_01020 [Bacillus sp. HMSC76G11]|nr:hypothetical protein HMPREF3291_01020 [Bacillus sp. HMSC76G11]